MPIGVGAGIALGSLASGLLGGASNVAGAMLSYYQQKKLAKYNADLNYKYSKKSALNTPTWNRTGLESAGYNPMLAVQNSTSGVNSSWTSAQSANVPDISSGISSGIANAQSFQRLKNETEQAEAIVDNQYAGADKANAEKAEIVERLPYVSKQAKADYMKTTMETAKLENDIHYQNEYINYLRNSLQLKEKLEMMGINVRQEANAISAIGKEEYADRAKRYKEFGERHPYLRNVDETLTRYFNGFGFNGNKKLK